MLFNVFFFTRFIWCWWLGEFFSAQLFTDLILKDYYTTFDFLHKFSKSHLVFNYKFLYCGENNKMKNMWGPQIKWNVEGRQMEKLPTFMYLPSLIAQVWHYLDIQRSTGTYHVDEYGYALIKEGCHLPEKDEEVTHTICTLWSNFIKNG